MLLKAADAGYPEDKIDQVLLVGGSTRMNQVRDTLNDRFPGKVQLYEPDKAVAWGAAIACMYELQGMQPTYQGVEASCYSSKKGSMMLYILRFKTVVGGNQAIQYASMAERQADMVVSRFFGGRNVFAYPPIVRAYMAFSYIQQNCEFDDLAESTKENDQPENPWTHVAFGPLCKGVGIAMGIADAYRVLLGKMGISSRLVHGEARDEDTSVSHTWCVINIGTEWFFSDPTYGVNGPSVDVTRFIFNGQKARNDYLWEESRFPSCFSLRPNYTDVSNYVDSHLGQMIANGVEERYISDDYVD